MQVVVNNSLIFFFYDVLLNLDDPQDSENYKKRDRHKNQQFLGFTQRQTQVLVIVRQTMHSTGIGKNEDAIFDQSFSTLKYTAPQE
ncbi:hypothetical protein pb186bvf_020512 [Paramecium bursaria]